MEEPTKLAITAVLSSAATILFQWLKERRTINANAQKMLSETDNQSFTIRSEHLQKWINIASNAEEKIGELRMQVAEEKISKIPLQKQLKEQEEVIEKYRSIERELQECQESMKKCKEHRCKES